MTRPPSTDASVRIVAAMVTMQNDDAYAAAQENSWIRRSMVAPLLDALAKDIAQITDYRNNLTSRR